jgi:diadenosine tetraphosphate (Ap4A) HIT family hydrolase
MSVMCHLGVVPVLLFASVAWADVADCACDPKNPATMERRECALCREAEKQPASPAVFFLKDINPRKPNRWLALPRSHGKTPAHRLADMTPEERTELWSAAIRKGRELWGDGWGLAINGDYSRTQCHMHIHIGKLLEGLETDTFKVVDGPAGIPVPTDGDGIWVHPCGDKLHVHYGEQITETVLMR